MKKLAILAAMALIAGSANAITISLHSSNLGIGTMNWSLSGSDLSIWEDWTVSSMGALELTELTLFEDYTVTKYITNNTGVDWTHMAHELLDPAGNTNDVNHDISAESWVPAGFSHSNNYDGLSFAQGSPIPRTSTRFSSLTIDELAGKDYIDFFDGLVSGAGGTDTVSYGLRNHNAVNEPFVLAQRPNEFTEEPIPEPTTLILFGLGLAGVAIRNRFRK